MSGKHTIESRATMRLVRATYVLALVTVLLVLVTALLTFHTEHETHQCPIPAVVHERRAE
jgi:hypothetical protein